MGIILLNFSDFFNGLVDRTNMFSSDQIKNPYDSIFEVNSDIFSLRADVHCNRDGILLEKLQKFCLHFVFVSGKGRKIVGEGIPYFKKASLID